MIGSEPFLQEILAAPADDAPRLVYADWLEEQGDPRGEFIRIQCELAQSPVQPSRLDPLEKDLIHDGPPELRIREAELLREHERQWLGAVGEHCAKWMFHRGFVEYVEVGAVPFVEHGSQLFAEHPIQAVNLTQLPVVAIEKVAKCTYLSRLAGLSIGPRGRDSISLYGLLNSEHFPRLTRLIMIRNGVSDSGIEMLAKADRLSNLQELNLTGNDIRNDGVETLVNSATFLHLESLHLNTNSIRLLGARAIAESPYLQQLQYLDVRNNPIPRRGIDVIRARFGRGVCDS